MMGWAGDPQGPFQPFIALWSMLLDHVGISVQADCRILTVTLCNTYNCVSSIAFKVKVMKLCLRFQYVGLQSSVLA